MRVDLTSGDFFHLDGLDPLIGHAIKMEEGFFRQCVGIGVGRKHLGHSHFFGRGVEGLLGDRDRRNVLQAADRDGV